ncbi:MAG: hypothetical protein NUV64_03130 [Parcubacteria group bacterium]|nr:hypothetical protein [Parcubacteria group bacterium]MCR4342401.1 hypothetical protein [Patescibacteria group bacterium]
MGILRGIMSGIDMVLTQRASNEGFEDGANGEAPRVVFGSSRFEEAYNRGYQAGRESHPTKIMGGIAKAVKKIDDL